MTEMNSKKPIGAQVNKALAVPRHHAASIVETRRARGKESVPRVSERVIGNPADGGSAGDWIDLSIEEPEDQYRDDPETLRIVEAQQDTTSFAAKFARQKEIKRKRLEQEQQQLADGGGDAKSKAKKAKVSAGSVIEVMPREMREEAEKDLDFDDGMQDFKTMKGQHKRFSNRYTTWY